MTAVHRDSITAVGALQPNDRTIGRYNQVNDGSLATPWTCVRSEAAPARPARTALALTIPSGPGGPPPT